jgi:hypothetical protein
LARNGQVRVGCNQVGYQSVQLDELSPTMYHTWGWGVGNPLGPKFSLSPLKSKFSDNKAFIDYCDESFDISPTTIYTYLNVYYLCEDFPSILLSGFGINKLYKYSKLIIKSAKEDNDLNMLLTKQFPGIKSDNI